MANSSQQFCIIIDNDTIGVFNFIKKWEITRIQKEEWNDFSSFGLEKVIEQLRNKINHSGQLSQSEFILVYPQKNFDAIINFGSLLHEIGCTKFNILCHESIDQAQKNENQTKLANLTNWHLANTLANIQNFFDYSGTTPKNVISKSIVEKETHLKDADAAIKLKEKSKQMLERECHDLKQQIESMERFNREELLSYLPIIFRNFWSSVSPTDIALLLNSITPPVIPSPYPEPSPDTIEIKLRKFKQLPHDQQKKIMSFCKDFRFKLEMRPDFKKLQENFDD